MIKMKRMSRKGELTFGGIVVMFVGIIFALALLTPIVDTIGGMSNKQVSENLTISVVSAYNSETNVSEEVNFTIFTQSAWKQIDCPLTSVALRNGVGTALVADTDYTLYAGQGVFSLLNTSLTEPQTALNITAADFTYCLDGYNKDASSRSMLVLIVIMSSLIILAFVLEHAGLDIFDKMGFK